MEFGKIDADRLKEVDWTLPVDAPQNAEVLANGTGNTRFYIGCATWGRKDWVGTYYPKGTREQDFLVRYSTVFNTVEFNGFYYNIHSRQQAERWAAQVADGFMFCPKFTQSITHYKRLRDASDQLDAFLEVVTGFGNKLGPLFLMPHPQMSPGNLDTITAFMESLPIDISVFLELRHNDWFQVPGGLNLELYEFMRRQQRGLEITDVSGRRDCAHMHLSTPECFIRFVGNGLHATDFVRIDMWVERLALWMKQGLSTCYFFMHQPHNVHSPELLRYFIRKLNERTGANIAEPKYVTGQALELW